ncbi:hypothetical protein FVR03_02640 [Pontibacter qinzhouensis]|uniref:Uncharacterized protein n=1 Tax=Pontibacter qinzhouensis TaxID=2603253 RepID=A0A5C8KF77_9BACT|nr:hypothetical protein [Pontibacter qinzhouensis]TXK51997.1 hypothetical protein FVR03_02640 [Pontibacter qinzhouensis]
MSDEKIMADTSYVEHMFLQVESSDAVCVLNIAGHPYRLRELIFMMIENGCRVMKTTADSYNTFSFDKERVEVYDYLTTIIKAKFL